MFLPLRDDAPKPPVAVVTISIVALNIVIFVIQTMLPTAVANQLLYAGGAIPFEISRLTDVTIGPYQTHALVPPPLTILTSLFLHGSVMHVIGNVWFLWVFARSVEAALGPARFALFYLFGGVLAAMTQVIMTPGSLTPMVGASGAIAAILGAYTVLYPRARIELLLFLVVFLQIVVVPAFVGLGIWFLWQLVGNRFDLAIATWAHIGGFAAGAVLCKLLARRLAAPVDAPALVTPPWTLLETASESSSSLP